MAVDRQTLESAILQGFPGSKVELVDMAGDDDHWLARISSAVFAGKSRVEQHRMVFSSLSHLQIHALSLEIRAE